MKEKELKRIFDKVDSKWEGDNALKGLLIIQKYFPENTTVICGASHDVIWSVDVDKICERITKEDAMQLALLNWHIDEDSDCLSCFV